MGAGEGEGDGRALRRSVTWVARVVLPVEEVSHRPPCLRGEHESIYLSRECLRWR